MSLGTLTDPIAPERETLARPAPAKLPPTRVPGGRAGLLVVTGPPLSDKLGLARALAEALPQGTTLVWPDELVRETLGVQVEEARTFADLLGDARARLNAGQQVVVCGRFDLRERDLAVELAHQTGCPHLVVELGGLAPRLVREVLERVPQDEASEQLSRVHEAARDYQQVRPREHPGSAVAVLSATGPRAEQVQQVLDRWGQLGAGV